MTTRIEKIGNATLYLGDCLDILPTLEKVDAVITDPPYGIGLDYQSETFNDSKDELKRLIDFFMPQCLAISNLVSITSGNINHYLYPQPTWTLCWFNRAGAGVGPWGFSCWQPILVYGKDPYLRNRKGRRPDYIETSDPSEKNGHPCPKPLNFIKLWINRVAFDAKTILDPFMGSGTTGVACAQLGRSFIGIEREPAYFDIACERIEQAYKQGQLFEHEPIIKQIQGDLL